MQIVIDIPDEVYNDIMYAKDRPRNNLNYYEDIISKGVQLPKGYGDLKDEDEIVKAIEDRVEFLGKHDEVFRRLRKDIDVLGCIPKIRREVPTIIEADKSESEDNIFENLTDEEQKNLWMYMIFNKDKIKENTEKWTKEAEEAGITLTEYLESISPLNNNENHRSR